MVKVGDSAKARVKHSFSLQHLRAAAYFSDNAEALEAEAQASPDRSKLLNPHRAYVTGAIISAVAALEASINELFLEACDRNPHTLTGLSPAVVDRLADEWQELERTPILTKYQIALQVAGKSCFDKGAQPFQDTASLMELRHALVHYKPEWDDEREDHENLEVRLSGRFDLNSLAGDSSLWFPHRCLGAGCARWSEETARLFLREFCLRLGIPSRC